MNEKKSDWMKIKPQELQKIVIDLAKEGKSPAMIGLILRDKHGIPKSKLIDKKVSKIITEAKLPVPTEKEIFNKKIENISKHISLHKHDYTAKRSLTKRLWAIKKLN